MKTMLCIFFMLPSFTLLAQTSGDEAYTQRNYKLAAEEYLKSHETSQLDSAREYHLGISLLHTTQYMQGIEHLNHARALGFPPSFVDYHVAKAYALNGNASKMLATLKTAADNGLPAYKRIKSDSAFASYMQNTDLLPVLQQIKENAYPCLTDANFRHFDFWLGEWNVLVNGRKAGENSITMANGGCVINESYTTAGDYTGQSMNYYDRKDQKWHQVWVGSAGGVLDYVEIDKREGMLQFQCEFLNPQGNISHSRLTFTKNEDGSVRQFFENSTDGKTWTPSFDGHYIKKDSGN